MSFTVLPLNQDGINPPVYPSVYNRNLCSYLRSTNMTFQEGLIGDQNTSLIVSNAAQIDNLTVNQSLYIPPQIKQNLISGCVQGIVAGDNVTVDSTDPNFPIISSTGGGGGSGTSSSIIGYFAYGVNSSADGLYITTTGSLTNLSGGSQVISVAGTLKNLYISQDVAPGVGEYCAVKLVKNGDDTLIIATISDNDTTANDTTNTVDVSPGDTIAFQILTSSSPVSANQTICIELETSGGGGSGGVFEGISVYLPNDLTAWTSADVIAPWSASLPGFYTNANFNLTTGEYTIPETGKYLVDGNFNNQGGGATLYVNDINFFRGKGGDSSSTIVTQEFQQGDVLTFKSNTTANIYKYGIGFEDGTILSITKVGGSSSQSSSFKGLSVVLASDVTYTFPLNIGNWTTPDANYYTDSAFNLSTGVFTAPTSSHYQFSLTLAAQDSVPELFLVVNDTNKQVYTSGTADTKNINGSVFLQQGDTISFKLSDDNTIYQKINDIYSTWLTINRIESSIVTSNGITVVEVNVTYNEVDDNGIKTLFDPLDNEYICLSISFIRDLSSSFLDGDGSFKIFYNGVTTTTYPVNVNVSAITELSSYTNNINQLTGETAYVGNNIPIQATIVPDTTSYTAGNIYLKLVLQKL